MSSDTFSSQESKFRNFISYYIFQWRIKWMIIWHSKIVFVIYGRKHNIFVIASVNYLLVWLYLKQMWITFKTNCDSLKRPPKLAVNLWQLYVDWEWEKEGERMRLSILERLLCGPVVQTKTRLPASSCRGVLPAHVGCYSFSRCIFLGQCN